MRRIKPATRLKGARPSVAGSGRVNSRDTQITSVSASVSARVSQVLGAGNIYRVGGYSPPVWQSVPDVSFVFGRSGQAHDLSQYAFSPNGDTLYFGAPYGGLPAGVTISADGVLSYDGTSALASGTTQVDANTTALSEYRFAEIPEIVFVNGLAEVEQLGVQMLDPSNKWTPGDMTRASGWQALPGREAELIDATTLTGVSSQFVSINPTTLELTYTGGDTGVQAHSLTVRLRSGAVVSDPFKIRILRPLVAWGDDSYATVVAAAGGSVAGASSVPHVVPSGTDKLGQAYGRYDAPTSDSSCVLITSNTATHDLFYTSITSAKSAYFLGLPGKTQCGINSFDKNITAIVAKRVENLYFRNLILTKVRISGGDNRTTTVSNVKLTDTHASDAVALDSFTPAYPFTDRQAWCFINNVEAVRCGQSGTKHPFYIHLQDDPSGYWGGMDTRAYINNVWSRGNSLAPWNDPDFDYVTYGANAMTQGGINLKVTTKYVKIRNCKLESCDNWADAQKTYMSSQMLSVVASSEIVAFNNHLKLAGKILNPVGSESNWGQSDFVIFQNRTMLGGGATDPAYLYDIAGSSYLEDIAGRAPLYMEYEFPSIPAWQPLTSYSVGSVASANGRSYRCVTAGVSGTTGPTGTLGATGKPEIVDGTVEWEWLGQPCPDFHGTNDYKSAPIDAPFWNLVGDVSDPANTNARRKFFSENLFEWYESGAYTEKLPNTSYSDKGTAPNAPVVQFSSLQIYYNVPPNWKERSRVYIANNVYSDNLSAQTARYEYEVPEPASRIHTYAPTLPTAVPMTIVGGEAAVSETQVKVSLPGWFEF